MATYFPSSSNQRDVIPALYVREPVPDSYPEVPVLPGNMIMYLNYPSSAGSYADNLARNSQPQNNCIEIPSVGASQEQDYGVWRNGKNDLLFMRPADGPPSMLSIDGQLNSATDDLVRSSVTEDSQMGMQTHGILQGGQNLQGQGLSLSLSTQIPSAIPVPSFHYGHPNPSLSSFLTSHQSISGEGGSRSDESSQTKQLRNAEYLPLGFTGGNHDVIKGETMSNLQCSVGLRQMHSDPSPYGLSGLASTIPNSNYLKVAQQLLDEVVNVGKALKQPDSDKHQCFNEFGLKGPKEIDGGSNCDAALTAISNSSGELSPAEKQDLQNKMIKLLSMLDEVDKRYRQYYHQMQIVVSSFDMIAGCGAAKPYTALALQTISRHFRCLRDAIGGQIQVTRRNLGEQDASANGKGGGISRLRYVDQQLRQQRTLQQLGMMQQHAWRPQRGLPESSVSILRAWLFEHFLHPYPKDSDKIMLARQTGLSRSQVSNWFINARVRLWKPMVEEMYKEETGDIEMDSNSSSENAPKEAKEDIRASEDRSEELQQSVTSAATERCHPGQFHDSESDILPDLEMTRPTAGASFRNGAHGEDNTNYGVMKLRGEQRPNADDCSLFQDVLLQSDGSGDGRFMAASYLMSESGRFGSGRGVSLTLGLQHCEGGGLLMSDGTTHQNFVTMREEEIYNASAPLVGPDVADFDCMDSGNRQHRFGTSHLLHDFVA
ncbi:hypothetical protein HHK36_008568 [Tetracentron sinense]|uniref:Homeobox domain-containing protein n=1 Tax=Tetracentron sinense TaxID=13715 RepID=A0A834ZJ92_TETSI|nr:hypothetical protein HHK36_008568 [Tetracentron sinense]